MTLHALLVNRDICFLLRFLKQQIIHLALLRGRERCTYPLPKQFPLSLGHPSRSLLLLRLPPVNGGQDGRGGLPTPSSTAPLLKAAAGVDAGSRSATIRLGAATGGRVEAAAARRGRTCWIASVYSCAAGNCWAMLPVGSPKRPVWDTGTLRNRTMSVSLCQPDTARGGAPGPQVWTSHDPETVP